MSATRIFLASLPAFCQKLSKLVEILRSSGKNNFAQFFETRCRVNSDAVITLKLNWTKNHQFSVSHPGDFLSI